MTTPDADHSSDGGFRYPANHEPDRRTREERSVAAGAALLDEKGPLGWRYAIIHGGPLDMYLDCVLDRVYGSYAQGKDALNLKGGAVVDHGFCPMWSNQQKLARAWMDEAHRGQRR